MISKISIESELFVFFIKWTLPLKVKPDFPIDVNVKIVNFPKTPSY